ncbi:MAG: transporter substrate-binding protein [Bacilli bacterium]|nr:transporter substrate-binding protein [Bacilli bacterium]
MLNKAFIPFSAAALGVLVVMTGCGSQNSAGGLPSNTGNGTKAGTYPIVSQKETLKVLTKQEPYVEDYNTNDFTKFLENKTNIHVDWQVIPAADAKTKIQVQLAGGQLPDIFMNDSLSDSQIVDYGTQGVFIPLNQLIDKYAPNIKKMMDQNPNLKQYMVAPDGNIYNIPDVGGVLHTAMPKKMWIYKPWLDKLGLKVPTTTAELYNVLKAFKTQDPNGKGNEIPLSGASANAPVNASNNEPESFIMQSFIYYDRTTYLYLNNGQVQFSADKPAFRDGVKYMRQLVQDGLLQPEAFTQDRKALTALAEDPSGDRLGAATSLYWGHFTIDNGPSGRYKDYVAVPVLAGPDGKRYGYDRGYPVTAGGFAIAKDCKDPIAAIRWMDYFYNEQAQLDEGWSPYWGQIGVGWKKPDAGIKGIDGRTPTYEAIIPFGTKTNSRWSQTNPGYQTPDYILSEAATPASENEVRLFDATNQLYKPYSDAQQQVPHMFFSDEDLAKNGDLQKNLDNIVQQFLIKFATGNLDVNNDSDWNKYLKELDNAGLKQYVQIYQDNYAKLKK